MKLWAARAMHEVRNANRTWFCTFTLAPEEHYRMQCRAIARAGARSIPETELSEAELADRQSAEVGAEVTLFLKRVRKEIGSGSIRYLLVREKHKSGLPHYHALLHEVDRALPVKHKVLSENWKLGHANFKLLDDERAAFYVVKYLGKSNEGRVRASLRYGRQPVKRPSDIVNEVNVLSPPALLAQTTNKSQNDEASIFPKNQKRSFQVDFGLPKEVFDLCEQETT